MTTTPAPTAETNRNAANTNASDEVPLKVRIMGAMVRAKAERIPLMIGVTGHGVVCTSTLGSPRWERDPNQAGCDPIGCLILQEQPEATDIEAAAVEVTRTNPLWVEAFLCGLEKRGREGGEQLAPHELRWVLQGWEDGSVIRMAIAGMFGGRLPRVG
jgi:hypothetical protein